jgi:predicted esterase
MTAARGAVDQVAALASANMGLWGQTFASDPQAMGIARQLFEQELDPLQGVDAAQLISELAEHHETWNLVNHASTLAARRVLLVAGKRDDVVLPFDHHVPLVKALEQAGAARFEKHLISADHGFSDQRIALARLLLDWLQAS